MQCPKKFLSEYYGTLLKNPQNLSNFFLPNACLRINKERDDTPPVNTDYEQAFTMFFPSRPSKILLVSYDQIIVDRTRSIMVIGQLVFEDCEMARFIENLVINSDNLIVSTSIRILDEEIIYQKKEFYNSLVNDQRKSVQVRNWSNFVYKDVNENFSQYGKIVAVERKDLDVLIEFESYDSVERVRNHAKVLCDKGIEIVENKRLV